MISGFSSNTLKLTMVPWKLLSFLQPTTISSGIKYEYPWIKVTKLMTGHHRIPSKMKPRLFTCFNRPNDRAKFDYWGLTWIQRPYRFFITVTLEILTKKLFILTSWGSGKKLKLIEGCWSNSSKLLPNYL